MFSLLSLGVGVGVDSTDEVTDGKPPPSELEVVCALVVDMGSSLVSSIEEDSSIREVSASLSLSVRALVVDSSTGVVVVGSSMAVVVVGSSTGVVNGGWIPPEK